MKKITVYILSLLLLGSICSCLDDKNNYDYTPVNELKGNINNIEKNYSVGIDEDLVITPTFEFTIDKTAPDVSYEWRLDGELLKTKTSSYTFNSHKIGLFELTFSVIDNKTGVKFSASTNILVRSPYQRGWVILSDVDGKSTLSFIKIKTLYGVTETTNIWGEKVIRDSIAYHSVEKYLVKNLGNNPKGIFEHLGYPSAFGQMETVYDELVVMQDRWVELNGNTLEREVYTEDEFYGDLPAGGFKPVEAAMSYSAKFIRDENGYIYMHMKPLANDFHAGAYMSIPLWNNTKFSALYPVQKFRDRNMDMVLALREEDNSLVVIRNGGEVTNSSSDPTIRENTKKDTGEVVELEGEDAKKFQNMRDESIVAMKTATINYNGDMMQAWVALIKGNDASYQLRYFRMKNKNLNLFDYYENDLTALNNKEYTDMAVFEDKKYVVIATGNELWYCQYVAGVTSTPKLLHTFDKKVVALSSNDIYLYAKYGEYNGQLGVALEDGSFFIYGVVEKDKAESGLVDNAEIEQLYPNEVSEKEGDNKFGKIVDVLYKIGNANQIVSYDL
ncbi:PKD-like family lipoprotein [Bacteroides congonensis]|uniref:PKD-like family lipoprotein n=1 Tax=Bacteroides congonensis TaxID=1871006 RepID=UPI00189A7E25|nr:PKD-like family lipoprotein [Bacteroides congonensis]